MAFAGIAMKLISVSFFTGMIICVKLLGNTVPTGQVVFFRSFFALLLLLIVAFWQSELKTVMATQRPLGHFTRGIVGSCAMGLWFMGLARLPLPEATAIGYAAPLFTTALAVVMLGEVVRIHRWLAIGAGLIGVLVILSPRLGVGSSVVDPQAQLGAICALASTFCMALAQVYVRKLTRTEKTLTIVFYFSATTSLLSLLTIPFGWVMPEDPMTLALLIGTGVFGGLGQIFLTQSYRLADVSIIAPYEYSSMVFAILIGWLLFSEVPTTVVLIGATIVIGAGLFIIYRESRIGIERAVAKAARTPH